MGSHYQLSFVAPPIIQNRLPCIVYSDGSIDYLGLKNTLIKPRGLLIEMGDVEHHLLSHPSGRRAMVALPTAGPYSDQLTAILELHSINEPKAHTDIYNMSKSERERSRFRLVRYIGSSEGDIAGICGSVFSARHKGHATLPRRE
jgi:hypothetical protein